MRLFWGFLKQQALRVNWTQKDHCLGTTKYSFSPSGQHNSVNKEICLYYILQWLAFNCFLFQPFLLLVLMLLPRPGVRQPAQQVLPHWNSHWKLLVNTHSHQAVLMGQRRHKLLRQFSCLAKPSALSTERPRLWATQLGRGASHTFRAKEGLGSNVSNQVLLWGCNLHWAKKKCAALKSDRSGGDREY